MYLPNTLWTWTFFLVTLVQAIIALALECYVFGRFESSLTRAAKGKSPPIGALTIPTYLTIFIFGFLYQLGLVWDALRLKNTIQVIGICFYNLGMLIYAAVEISQVDDAVHSLGPGGINSGVWEYLRPCLVAAPCVLALGTFLLAFVAWKLYGEFAWSIYKHISADLRLKRRYLTYQIYIALLKFDFFFFLGFAVQLLVLVHVQEANNYEFALTIAALPVIVVLLFLAAYFVRRESYVGHSVVIILYFAALVYFIFKLWRMYDSPLAHFYSSARHTLTSFAVLTILLLVMTIGTAFMVMANFGKGLRPHIQKRKVLSADDMKYANYGADTYQGPSHALGQVPNRMTID